MFSLHHWPGMALVFLFIVLSPLLKEVCKQCFYASDEDEPMYDWISLPIVNFDDVYYLPILEELRQ
jgi:hypothetical protein